MFLCECHAFYLSELFTEKCARARAGSSSADVQHICSPFCRADSLYPHPHVKSARVHALTRSLAKQPLLTSWYVIVDTRSSGRSRNESCVLLLQPVLMARAASAAANRLKNHDPSAGAARHVPAQLE